MRVDYFLKISRLVKRRPLAKEMCDKHLIQLNEQMTKAGKEVEKGDTLTIRFRHRTLKIQVEDVPEHAVSKDDASSLYTVLEDIGRDEEE